MEEKSLTLARVKESESSAPKLMGSLGLHGTEALGSNDYAPPLSIASHPHPIKLVVQMSLEEPPQAGEMAELIKCLPCKCGNWNSMLRSHIKS